MADILGVIIGLACFVPIYWIERRWPSPELTDEQRDNLQW